MTQDAGARRKFFGSRALYGVLIVLSAAGFTWLAVDRIDGKDSRSTEVVTARGASLDPTESQQTPTTSENIDGNVGSESDATQTPTQPDLGLEEIVREFILTLYGGETGRPDSGYAPSTYAKLESTDLTTKSRGQFELEVRVQLGARLPDDPYYLMLQKSMFDNWDKCLAEYGLPSLEGIGQLTEEQQEALVKERNLVGDRMIELENKCWGQSRIYAGKDDETDRLLGLQHQYYLSAAQVWVEANAENVVLLPG